ncbi:MAG: sensor domain-containing diguanylate cyclase [Chloroflexi bacterium]|nr:sensor domain-containing diguanylate cyclase [Chloroflexota bacterium]
MDIEGNERPPSPDVLSRLEKSVGYLEVLRQASLQLTSSLNLKEVLYALLESAFKLVGDTHDANIFLYEGGKLSFGAAIFEDGRRGKPWAEPRQDGLTYTVARSGKVLAIEDMKTHPLFQTAPSDWNGAIIGLPLKYGSRVLGVMNISWPTPRHFDQEELHAMELLADQAAIAVENARLHTIVQNEALTDPLTGLPNRRAFDLRLAEEVRRSARYHHTFTVLMVDLDDFKRVNDTHGHMVGDVALREIARCLRRSVRDTDFMARFGGDEFVLILPEAKAGDEGPIAQKLREAAKSCQLGLPGDKTDSLTLSIGAASFPQDATKAAGLMFQADRRFYEKKKKHD